MFADKLPTQAVTRLPQAIKMPMQDVTHLLQACAMSIKSNNVCV